MERVRIGRNRYVSVSMLECGKHMGVHFDMVRENVSVDRLEYYGRFSRRRELQGIDPNAPVHALHKLCIWDGGYMHTFLTKVAPLLNQHIREPAYSLNCRIDLHGYVYAKPLDNEISFGTAQANVSMTVEEYWRFWGTIPEIIKALQLDVDQTSLEKAQMG